MPGILPRLEDPGKWQFQQVEPTPLMDRLTMDANLAS
jgi:hypothetical protein